MSRPGLTAEFIFERLAEFVRTDPNWIIGEPPASVQRLVERIRQRGLVGPLWTCFGMLQRLASPPPRRAEGWGPRRDLTQGNLRACAQRVPMRPEKRGPAPRLSAGTLG